MFKSKKDSRIKKKEKDRKINRERKMVEGPFREEVEDRIRILRRIKKMIQTIVTGAEPKMSIRYDDL